jgi:tetratricopeptide (TPR) repeat protein
MATATAEEVQPGVFGFTPAKYFFYEGTCHVRLGQPDAALAASEQALALYQPTKAFNEPTIARIDMAMAYAKKGDLDQACQLTRQAAAIPADLRTGPIVARVQEFSPAWNHGIVACRRSRKSASNSPSLGPGRRMAHEAPGLIAGGGHRHGERTQVAGNRHG